jgi:hypothetical protein
MSEHEPGREAGTPGPAPLANDDGDVKGAAAWLITHRDRYTEIALNHELRVAGYSEDQITAIRAEAERIAPTALPEPAGTDLRARAAGAVIIAFLAVWAVLTVPWLNSETDRIEGFGALVGFILGLALLVVGVPSLIFILRNDRLKRGTAGAVVAALTAPFILLFVVAGLCVATVGIPRA